MHILLKTLDPLSDDGYEAMATVFRASAETLLASDTDPIAHRELPTCLLLRHASELFLKSTLVVTHRAFTTNALGYPAIPVDGKTRPLTNVHGLGPLYGALIATLNEHRIALEERTRTAWLPMPRELDDAIAAIDEMDDRGEFFWNLAECGNTKSNRNPIRPEEILAWDPVAQDYRKAFVVFDQNEEIVKAFDYHSGLLKRELAILKAACELLNCFHVALRMELAGEW
ncbi:hypothetical protein [Dyella humicola]|uniref:hypothetical protein n=1 Tax=Dyella humicola TaxID=2992126 RepID=UPI002257C494|nr:hypothetical protein [Dyella humicola]